MSYAELHNLNVAMSNLKPDSILGQCLLIEAKEQLDISTVNTSKSK